MSLIRYCLLAASIFYIVLFMVQGTLVESILFTAAIGVVILIGVGSTLFISDELHLKKTKMILIWCCVLAFAGYGLFRGGMIV